MPKVDSHLKIGVVAHHSRIFKAYNLFRQIEADYISIDQKLGCDLNHQKVWQTTALLAQPDEWIIVIEDDAIPVDHFRDKAAAALDHTPDGIDVVSFYLGRLNPAGWQPYMETAVAQADRADASWITSNTTLHGVCLAIRGPRLVESMLSTAVTLVRPIDERITMWCRRFGHDTAYSHPSIVQHSDLDPCITTRYDKRPREKGRVAWRFGDRETWSQRSVPLKR